MLPLLAAAAAGWYFSRGKTRKNPGRRPHRRRRVSWKNPGSGDYSVIVFDKSDWITLKSFSRKQDAQDFIDRYPRFGADYSRAVREGNWQITEPERNPDNTVAKFLRRRNAAGMKTSYPFYVVHPSFGQVNITSEAELKAYIKRAKSGRRVSRRNPASSDLSGIVEHALKLAKRGHWKAAWSHAGDAQRLIIQRPELAEYRGEIIELRNALASRKLPARWTNPPIPYYTLLISRVAAMTRDELIKVLRYETGGIDATLPTPELRRLLALEWSYGPDRNPKRQGKLAKKWIKARKDLLKRSRLPKFKTFEEFGEWLKAHPPMGPGLPPNYRPNPKRKRPKSRK